MIDRRFLICDSEVKKGLQRALRHVEVDSIFDERQNLQSYLDEFINWITNSSHNNVKGLDTSMSKVYSNGLEQSLQSFVTLTDFQGKRFRLSKKESRNLSWLLDQTSGKIFWIEDQELKENDSMFLSYPLTGCSEDVDDFNRSLDTADNLGVSVFLDLSWYAVGTGVDVDLSRPSISEVFFTLDPVMPVKLNLGLRISKHRRNDMIQLLSDQGDVNILATMLATALMPEYPHDWFVDHYLSKQMSICVKNNLVPSAIMTAAFDQQGNMVPVLTYQ